MVITTGKALDQSRLDRSGIDKTPVEREPATGRSHERDLDQDAQRFSALLRPPADASRPGQEPASDAASETGKRTSRETETETDPDPNLDRSLSSNRKPPDDRPVSTNLNLRPASDTPASDTGERQIRHAGHSQGRQASSPMAEVSADVRPRAPDPLFKRPARERDTDQDAQRFSARLRPPANASRTQDPTSNVTSHAEERAARPEERASRPKEQPSRTDHRPLSSNLNPGPISNGDERQAKRAEPSRERQVPSPITGKSSDTRSRTQDPLPERPAREPPMSETPTTDKTSSRERKLEEAFSMPTAGDRVLQGLQGMPAPPNASPAASAEITAPPAASAEPRMDRIAEQLAQRILVSERSVNGASEVRIQLRESILQGTEIRLSREQGELKIQFHVPNADLARQLSGQTDTMQQTLGARLNEPVRIDIALASSGARADTGQPGDGRSRNRQDPREAWNHTAETDR